MAFAPAAFQCDGITGTVILSWLRANFVACIWKDGRCWHYCVLTQLRKSIPGAIRRRSCHEVLSLERMALRKKPNPGCYVRKIVSGLSAASIVGCQCSHFLICSTRPFGAFLLVSNFGTSPRAGVAIPNGQRS